MPIQNTQILEQKIEWLENGLKEIANGREDMNPLYLKQKAQAILDGEPTTADAYNVGDDVEYKWVLPDDNKKLKKNAIGNRITMTENEESRWRENVIHTQFKGQGTVATVSRGKWERGN